MLSELRVRAERGLLGLELPDDGTTSYTVTSDADGDYRLSSWSMWRCHGFDGGATSPAPT
jgi:hypothetical protein